MPDEYDQLLDAVLPRKPKPSGYDEIINRHSNKAGIDPKLVRAVIGQESSGNRIAVSPKGARGLMQLMPATAQRFGVKDVNDPEQNIRAGTQYLKTLSDRFGGDTDLMLAGYNAGEGAVEKYGRKIPPYKETQNYVPQVKARIQKQAPDDYDTLLNEVMGESVQPAQVAPQKRPPSEIATGGAGPVAGRYANTPLETPQRIKPRKFVPAGPFQPATPQEQTQIKRAIPFKPTGTFGQASQEEQEVIRRAVAPTIRGQRMSTVPRVATEGVLEGAAGWTQSLESLSEMLPDVLAHVLPAARVAQTSGWNPVAKKLQEATDALRSAAEQTDIDPATGKPFRDAMSYWQSVPLDVLQAGVKAGFDIPRYVLLTRVAGPVMGFGIEGGLSAPPEERGKGVLAGTAMGGAFKGLEAVKPLVKTLPRRIGSFGALGATQTAGEQALIEGEVDPRSVMSSAITMGALGALGGRRRERTTETTKEPAAETRQVDTSAPLTAAEIPQTPIRGISDVYQPESNVAVGTGKPATVPEAQAWQHRDLGLVKETPNQGVGKKRVRVVDETGKEHVIKRAALTGAGNQIAIPVKVPPAVDTLQGQPNLLAEAATKSAEVLPLAEGAQLAQAKTTPSTPEIRPKLAPPKVASNVESVAKADQAAIAVKEPRKMNFTQFAKSIGAPSDYDVLEHGRLGPSGHMSERSRTSESQRHLERSSANTRAHEEFEAAIRRGEIIDAEELKSRRVTKEGLEARDTRAADEELRSNIASIDSQIRTIENLGPMSHLPNGKLKAKYQRTVDIYNARKAELLEGAQPAMERTPSSPAESVSIQTKAGQLAAEVRTSARELIIEVKGPKGELVGDATFSPNPDGTWSAADVFVNKEWRRQGVATAIYDLADARGLKIERSGQQFGGKLSPDASEFWRNRATAKQRTKEVPDESTEAATAVSKPKLTETSIEKGAGVIAGDTPAPSIKPERIPIDQLKRSELKQRVRQGGARAKEYQQELDRRYESRGLAQFVRDQGGIAPGEMYAGELARLSPKETGTTGLINKNARTGSQKMSAEYMMDAANEEGYRDIGGNKFEHPADFILAVESDMTGAKKGYTKLTSGDEIDWDVEHQKRYTAEQEIHDADATVSLLENERSGIIYDRISEGKANESDLKQFRKYAEDLHISPAATETLIASARAESVQEARSVQTQTGEVKPRGQAGFLNIGKAGYVRAKTPILREVERTTQAAPSRPSVGQRLSAIPEKFQTAITSQFTPLRSLEKTLYGDKKIQGVDMARKFEQVAGAPAKAEADIIEFRQAVVDPIRQHADDFNSYLFLKRVADRLANDPDRKRVADWTPLKAQAGLAELRNKVGDQVMSKLEKAGTVYQDEMRKALRLQVESGRMSEDLYQRIVTENDFYAPFKVLKYIEEGEGLAGSGRKIATTRDLTKKITGIDSADFQIGNILQGSAEQIVRSRILAEKNLKMLELDKLADLDPDGTLIKRVDVESRPRVGYEQVRFFKDGNPTILEVQRPVAQAVQGLNEAQAGLITKALMVAAQPMRLGATSANAGFQVVNLLFADLPRSALISRYGVRSPLDMVRFPLDWTYSAFTSFKGNFGKPNDLYMEWLKSGAAHSTIQRELTPSAFKPTLGLAKGPKHLVKSVVDTVPKFANAIEETTKILGLRRGLRMERVKSLTGEAQKQAVERVVTEVRNYSGSPDFSRRGTETRQLNLLVMFLNARIQGTAADLARLAGRTGGKDAAMSWGRLGVAVGLPTTALALVNSLPDYKEDYDKIPEWEKENYWMIPRESFFVNEDTGERVRDYWRIPKREITKLFANTVESGIRFAQERDPKTVGQWATNVLENLSPVNVSGTTPTERIESAVGSLNPALKVPVEVATGRDTFRHRQIVPEYMKKADPGEQYRASTPKQYVAAGKRIGVSPLTVEHVAEGATGGGLGQFSLRQPQPGRSALTQYPIARRFVRSGSLASDSGMGERVQQAEQEETTKQVVRRRTAMTLLSEWRGASEQDIQRKLVTIRRTDPKLAEKIADIRKEQRKGYTAIDRQIAALGIESGERKKFIRGELGRMKSQAERDAFVRDMKKKGLLR